MTLLDGCSWGSQERANVENADRKQKAKQCSPHAYSNPHHKQAMAADSWVQWRRRPWRLILTVNLSGAQSRTALLEVVTGGRWGSSWERQTSSFVPFPLLPDRCGVNCSAWPHLLCHDGLLPLKPQAKINPSSFMLLMPSHSSGQEKQRLTRICTERTSNPKSRGVLCGIRVCKAEITSHPS